MFVTREEWKRIECDVRDNLRAWLRYYKTHPRECTNEGLADLLGLSEPTVTNVLNGKRTGGLDLLIRLTTVFRESASLYLYHPPEVKAVGAEAPDPRPASRGAAQAGKRKIEGGA